MDLRSYINAFPRYERKKIRAALAQAHEVSEVTIRSWANGNRKHPCKLSAIEITERLTGYQVTRFDVRPDVFGPQAD